jgi:3-oxoacyl-[acyl-carrier protein] reductase
MTKGLFADQAAIVTGAGVGIGYEIARQLVSNGASVLLNDVDEALARQAAQDISQETGGKCEGIGGDVSDVITVQQLVGDVVQAFGRLDIAVANAGLTSWGDFFDYTMENFDRVVGINLRGSYFLAQAARQMRAQGSSGRILLMSSVTGHQAIRYLSCYAMTKAALEMLARNLVIELSPYGITINAVAPGATITPRNLTDDPNYEAVWGALIPTQHAISVEDIAQAALFLLSPQASQITGQTLIVDGGWSAVSPTPPLDFVQHSK